MREGADCVIKRATELLCGGPSCNPKKQLSHRDSIRAQSRLRGKTAAACHQSDSKIPLRLTPNSAKEKKAGESPPLSTRPRKRTQMM